MERPKIKIKRDRIDWLLDITGGIMVALAIALPVYHYSSLPENIPIHFNARGVADAYGSKEAIWVLAILVPILYAGMAILASYPHLFNYFVEITRENAERQYRMGARLIRILNLLVVGVFLYMVWGKTTL